MQIVQTDKKRNYVPVPTEKSYDVKYKSREQGKKCCFSTTEEGTGTVLNGYNRGKYFGGPI